MGVSVFSISNDINRFGLQSKANWDDFQADLGAFQDVSHMGIFPKEVSSLAARLLNAAQKNHAIYLESSQPLISGLAESVKKLEECELKYLHAGPDKSTLEDSKDHNEVLTNLVSIARRMRQLAELLLHKRDETVARAPFSLFKQKGYMIKKVVVCEDRINDAFYDVIGRGVDAVYKEAGAFGILADRVEEFANERRSCFPKALCSYELYMGKRLGDRTSQEWVAVMQDHWKGVEDCFDRLCDQLEKGTTKRQAAIALSVFNRVSSLRAFSSGGYSSILQEYQQLVEKIHSTPEAIREIDHLEEKVGILSTMIQCKARESASVARHYLRRMPIFNQVVSAVFEALMNESQTLLAIGKGLEKYREVRASSPPALGR